MKNDEAVIFDLDGTLTDTLSMSVEGSRQAVQKAGDKKLTAEEILEQFGKSEEALFKHYCPANWETAHSHYKDYFVENVSPKTLFPYAKEALEYLKKNGIKTAVVTGRSNLTAEVILERAGIRHYFDFVKTGDESGSVKPQRIKEILEAWGQPTDKTYYIGDIANDISDSRAAGVNPLSACWFKTAETEKIKKQSPLKIFTDSGDFLEWLKK